MLFYLITCSGNGKGFRVSLTQPPGVTINQEKKTWTYKGQEYSFNDWWATKLIHAADHILAVIEISFIPANEEHIESLRQSLGFTAATTSHFTKIII